MVITGNNELPTVLNIMPWRKTEKLSGFSTEFPEITDNKKLLPLHRSEFLREVNTYYLLNPEPLKKSEPR